MGRPQGHVPASQLRLPLRPGGAQEGAHLINIPLGPGPAQVGGGPHRTGEGRLHGVHPVVQPHQKARTWAWKAGAHARLRPLRRGAGHGQAGIGRPVVGQGPAGERSGSAGQNTTASAWAGMALWVRPPEREAIRPPGSPAR